MKRKEHRGARPRCAFVLLLCLCAARPSGAAAQLPLTPLPLDDLSSFRAPGDNWRIAGGASADRDREHAVDIRPGTGVLVNAAGSGQGENLFTTWEHGDIELELAFMMPRGSNSGVYLQGRYEIQLFDSWGVAHPRFSDAGGIYQRWDERRGEGRQGYEGHPPRVNVSRAPGLWQQLRIVFQAPRFNERGEKVANARFVEVVHNGVTIHQNVEVTGPTRAAAFEEEASHGPLMLQGDHGPVAFRNIRYKLYEPERVRLQDLRYRAYEGEFEDVSDYASLTPVAEGEARALTASVAPRPDQVALQFEGLLHAPAAGLYQFELQLGWIPDDDPHLASMVAGGGRLEIDGQTVLVHGGHRTATGQVRLEAGRHPFALTYFKNLSWRDNSMALYVEGPGVARHALHAEGALPVSSLVDPILVEPGRAPVVLRSFIEREGEKKTHAVSVGDPLGVHYALDLSRGALLYVWKGAFVDATPMWNSRGIEQLVLLLGSVIAFSDAPSLAFLPQEGAAWPEVGTADYAFDGYRLDAAGRPTFHYRLGTIEVEDRLAPGADGRALTRTLTLKGGRPEAGLWLRAAEGHHIERLPDGSYRIEGEAFYLELEGTGRPQPLVRSAGDRQELLLPISFEGDQATVTYSVIW